MPTVKRLKRRPAFTFPTRQKSPFIVNGLHVAEHGGNVVGLGQVNAILVQSGSSTYEVVGTVEQWVLNTTKSDLVLTFPQPYQEFHQGAANVTLRTAVNRMPWPLKPNADQPGVADLVIKRVKTSPAAPVDFLTAVHVARGAAAVGSFAYTRSVSSLQLITNTASIPGLGREATDNNGAPRLWTEVLRSSVGVEIGYVYGEFPDTSPNGASWTSRTRLTQVWPTSTANPNLPRPHTIDTGGPLGGYADRLAWFTAALGEFGIPGRSAGGFIEAWVNQYDALPAQMPTD